MDHDAESMLIVPFAAEFQTNVRESFGNVGQDMNLAQADHFPKLINR